MGRVNALVTAARALRAAAPHRLPGTLHTVLHAGYAAERTDLRLADYAQRALLSVAPDGRGARNRRPLPLHGSAPGRAYGAQEPFVEELDGGRVLAHLPVTVRGDRLGVLSVTLPGPGLGDGGLAELAALARLLGHEIVVAERDTDVYRQARRTERLTLAAEMQWQLLPARSCAGDGYALGAQLEPAYAVFGDNFDWAATADRLTVYVTGGMGEGIEASLLTGLGVNALRHARRAGAPIAEQAALAGRAVHAHYAGEAHLSVLLADLDTATGRLRVVDAGSAQLLLVRDRIPARITTDALPPLGLAEEAGYTAQEFTLLPGDRLLFVSDGVHAAASPDGEMYGEQALARAVASAALLPAADVPAAVLRELAGHRGGTEPDDDALVVCLDWSGRRPRSSSGGPGTDLSPGDGHSTVPSPPSGPQRHEDEE
ncbi:PP2C family protein-serine/threonine phosphatase [Streptomyces sp. NPDC048481]|uniref:PP2C family protein-serine/threonine phosphatase n=1 Tax=Streptomyces sp. NPDC048481 TaxID=3365557 RepID=UPI0037212F32